MRFRHGGYNGNPVQFRNESEAVTGNEKHQDVADTPLGKVRGNRTNLKIEDLPEKEIGIPADKGCCT